MPAEQPCSPHGLRRVASLGCLLVSGLWIAAPGEARDEQQIANRVEGLLSQMTLSEKIGQLAQLNSDNGLSPDLSERIRSGRVGSILNEVRVDVVNEMQRLAVEESRLGIPLLIGRDGIHGFNTVLPIPLGLAATFNPELVQRGARMAATEAASTGVNWTFAPMLDVTRDPRWGRIAESLGEDTYLTSRMAAAMVRGFQGERLDGLGSIAACAKHFAGYGASEAGRDYATTNIPENELRNVFLPPFEAAVEAGVATVMASFSDLNGVPATASRFLMTDVLRKEWGCGGFVVSDWASIEQLRIHGFTANDRDSAAAALHAGVNMEMATSVYANHLESLLEDNRISISQIDRMVADILRIKFHLGLFETPYTNPDDFPARGNEQHLEVARQAALESLVLLKNEGVLPLDAESLDTLALIGPMADDGYEQMGTWVFDGQADLSQTPRAALAATLGADKVRYVRALQHSRDQSHAGFDAALEAVAASDVVVLVLGEESILSGEAHSRANIDLPGAQAALVQALKNAGKPIVAVIMAGRPLTLGNILEDVDALLYAWHPGSMGGPAIRDVLLGAVSPSGRLPVTFPRMVGQVPIYYNQKHTGKPATAESFRYIDDIPVRMPQHSSGFVSSHLDAGYTPQFPFGFGMSYSRFEYRDLKVSEVEVPLGEPVEITATLTNTGDVAASEVAQLYIRDLVGNVTRPVRELKDFKRVHLEPGETAELQFELTPESLAFYGQNMTKITEPGRFQVWLGGDSAAPLQSEFTLTLPKSEY